MANKERRPEHQRWEDMLKLQNNGFTDKAFLDANAIVGDALFMAWLNWDACRPDMKPTAADLVETAKMIIQHHQWLKDREARDLIGEALRDA